MRDLKIKITIEGTITDGELLALLDSDEKPTLSEDEKRKRIAAIIASKRRISAATDATWSQAARAYGTGEADSETLERAEQSVIEVHKAALEEKPSQPERFGPAWLASLSTPIRLVDLYALIVKEAGTSSVDELVATVQRLKPQIPALQRLEEKGKLSVEEITRRVTDALTQLQEKIK